MFTSCMRNDDYTTRDFVVSVLREVFDLSDAEAEPRMMQVHNEGRGIVGRFKSPLAAMKIERFASAPASRCSRSGSAPEDC